MTLGATARTVQADTPGVNHRRRSERNERALWLSARRRRTERESVELPWDPRAPVEFSDWATSVTKPSSPAIPDSSSGRRPGPYDVPTEWLPEIDLRWHQAHAEHARQWQRRAVEARRRASLADRLNDSWRDARAVRGIVGEMADAAAERDFERLAEMRDADRWWPVSAGGVAGAAVNALALHRRAWYAEGRARTMALGRSYLLGACGLRKLLQKCACGIRAKDVGCQQIALCDRCRKPYYRKVRRRALRALSLRMGEQTTAWARAGYQRGQRPLYVLLTLTVPHWRLVPLPRGVKGPLARASVPLDERREQLATGWRRFRQWLHKRIGAFPFVGLPELAAKEDPRGHLHYHFVCIWPRWDWADAMPEWRLAIGEPGAIAPDMRVCKTLRGAAHYVGKYATKE
jgi:hypothetical protein